MGYNYDRNGHLCCDHCGRSGGVRKQRCPYNYCPSIAHCKDCYAYTKATRHTREAHAACKVGMEKIRERENRAAKILAEGGALRCSARGDDNKVHVLFRLADGSTIGRYMSSETYKAVSLLSPARRSGK